VSLLLDTNVLSELRKGARANARLRGWFDGVAADEIYLSVLVIGELRRGIELVRRRDARQAAALERWLTRVTADQADRILPVDTLMASTALVHGLVLVTRNVKDVAWTGVAYLNPFEATSS